MKSLLGSAATVIRDVAGILGAGLIVYGVWLIYQPAAFLVSGSMLMLAAWLIASRSNQ